MTASFYKRKDGVSRADALQQARNCLAKANPMSPDPDDNVTLYYQAAGLFLMYGSKENDLQMAGEEEISLLAHKLRDLMLDSALLDAIGSGLVVPGIDEQDELTIQGIPPEDFNDAGVPLDVQEQYYMHN